MAPGRDEQGQDEQHAHDLDGLGHCRRHDEEEHDREESHRHPARLRHLRIDGREGQRAIDDRERQQGDDPDRHEQDHVGAAHAGDRAEEDAERLRREPLVERQEEDAEPKAEGHDHAHHGVAFAHPDTRGHR